MASFSVAYTAQSGTVYDITFREFSAQEVMRTYQASVTFQRTVSGSQVLSGPPTVSKYVWGVSGLCDKTIGLQLDDLYRAWNLDRANGISAAVAVLDLTWGTIGQRSAVFSTPPSFTYYNNVAIFANFGLTEV